VSTRQVHCQWGAPHVQAGQALEDELEATRADAAAQANRLAAQLSAAVHASDCGAEAQRAEAAQLAAELRSAATELQSTQAELQSAAARQAELEEAAAGMQEEAELLQVCGSFCLPLLACQLAAWQCRLLPGRSVPAATHGWVLQAQLVRGALPARLAAFQRDDKLSRSESLLLVLLPLRLVAGTSAAAEAGGRCGGGRAAEGSCGRRLTRSAAPGPHRGAHGRGCSGRGRRGVAAAAGQGAARGGAGRCYGAGSPAGEPWPLADRLRATSGLQKAAMVMGEHGTHICMELQCTAAS